MSLLPCEKVRKDIVCVKSPIMLSHGCVMTSEWGVGLESGFYMRKYLISGFQSSFRVTARPKDEDLFTEWLN